MLQVVFTLWVQRVFFASMSLQVKSWVQLLARSCNSLQGLQSSTIPILLHKLLQALCTISQWILGYMIILPGSTYKTVIRCMQLHCGKWILAIDSWRINPFSTFLNGYVHYWLCIVSITMRRKLQNLKIIHCRLSKFFGHPVQNYSESCVWPLYMGELIRWKFIMYIQTTDSFMVRLHSLTMASGQWSTQWNFPSVCPSIACMIYIM